MRVVGLRVSWEFGTPLLPLPDFQPLFCPLTNLTHRPALPFFEISLGLDRFYMIFLGIKGCHMKLAYPCFRVPYIKSCLWHLDLSDADGNSYVLC
ncbi:Os02g0687550 [Oryza sativa Japonica Group]|uniref:Os02g0687550 protein n=1 Tax=Oryza sativa subsp. japonica TaxID=39947 RepID=A0A0P0VND2_ORYSJ|nr:hypothetical protein DAI22_02g291600 [Oryza sativa Japonica Group]BAS80347.1 Os02g0687550 [Oryza sativa Japonica Group]